MDIKKDLPFFKNLANALAKQFGRSCEVVVHDLTSVDKEHTIIAIENGHVTSRKIGGTASHVVLDALNADGQIQDKIAYKTRTAGGRTLKSSSVFIPGDDGKPVGLLGINMDITDMLQFQHHLESITGFEDKKEEVETITTTVEEVLDSLIDEAIRLVGKPPDLMDKSEKISAIQYLEKQGAFLIKFAGDKVTKLFNISKYTLYNYLKSDGFDLEE